MSCRIDDYGKVCCGGVKPFFPTGHVQNGYVRRVDGRFVRQDGLDLTSGYKDRLLVHPNGSKAGSQIFDYNEPALCK
jgi:hypothetical protein